MGLPSITEILAIGLLFLQPLIFTIVTQKITIKEISFIKTFFYYIGMLFVLRIVIRLIDRVGTNIPDAAQYIVQIMIIILFSIGYIMLLIKYKDKESINFKDALKISVVSKILFVLITISVAYVLKIFR